MAKIKFLLIFLLIAISFVGFTQEFYKSIYLEDSLSMPLHGNFTVLEIHINTKSQIRKNTKEVIKRKKKRFKQNKFPWVAEKPGKAIEAYLIKISDSTNYTYFIASMKAETTSKEKIIVGNTYVMELNMILYLGEVHGIHFKNLNVTNGTLIPLPREAQFHDIYISPNLQGLYYVK